MRYDKATIPFLLIWVFLGLVAVTAYLEVVAGMVLSIMAFLFIAVYFGVTNVPDE